MTAMARAPFVEDGSERSSMLWPSLLRRLSETCPGAFVWKNADPALEGIGDIDLLAVRSDWERVEAGFVGWATDHRLDPVIRCTHVPGNLFLLAPDPTTPALYELDVRDRITFRGSTVLTAEDAGELVVADPRGFRRLSVEAEGVVKLVLHGIAPGGKQKPRGLAKERVRDLLGDGRPSDAAALFGSCRSSVNALATQVVRGGWDRRSAAAVELRAALKGALSPLHVVRGLRRRRAKASCPVLQAIVKHDRCIPGDRDEWLELVTRTHRIERVERSAREGS